MRLDTFSLNNVEYNRLERAQNYLNDLLFRVHATQVIMIDTTEKRNSLDKASK